MGLSLLATYQKYYKSYCAFIITNSFKQLKFRFIETDTNTNDHSLYYPIIISCDAISKIEIPENLFYLDYQVKISLFDGVDFIPVGIFDKLNRSVRFEKFYYLLTRQNRSIYLVIQVPKTELNLWLQFNVMFGKVYLNNEERKYVSQNLGFI